MHAVGELGGSGVPAFLTKLWTLVDDSSTDELICWDPSGRSFHVFDPARFSKEYLPLYFKHSNIASFIRQLNMYGFRKIVNVESGGLKTEKDDMEFAHQYFVRDQESLLEFIKRKVATSKQSDDTKSEDLSKVLGEVRGIKGKQDNMSSKFESLKIENEALWREVASLRQKHNKQQQIVNKLIQFLLSLVGNRGLPSRKRTMPLMLNDGLSKVPKMSNTSVSSPGDSSRSEKKGLTIHDITDVQGSPKAVPQDEGLLDVISMLTDAPTQRSTTLTSLGEAPPTTSVPVAAESRSQGIVTEPPPVYPEPQTNQPIIQHVDSQIDLSNIESAAPVSEEYINIDLSHLIASSTSTTTPQTSQSPAMTTLPTSSSTVAVPDNLNFGSSRKALNVDCNLIAGSSNLVVPKSPKREEIGGQVDALQSDLDSIRDLLSGGQYSIDTSTLLNLFGVDSYINQGPMDLSMLPDFETAPEADASIITLGPSTSAISGQNRGKELVQYNPAPEDLSSLFDLGLDTGDTNLETPSFELPNPLGEEVDSKSQLFPSPTTEEVD